MSDCANQDGYDAIMLRIDFEGDEHPWMYPLALNGRKMERVTIGGVEHVPVRECEQRLESIRELLGKVWPIVTRYTPVSFWGPIENELRKLGGR